MTTLIPCGGSGTRWGNFGGTVKQLAQIQGRPLLDHLIESLSRAGAGAIGVVASSPDLDRPGALLLPPSPESLSCDLDKLHCARPYWSPRGRTWIVWGDLWLTTAGARRMREPGQPPCVFYGRSAGSRFTGKQYGELWGCSFTPEAHDRLECATRDVATAVCRSGEPARAWLVWARLQASWPEGCGSLVEIDDRTEDFDFPIDLARWEAASGRLPQ